MPKLHILQRYKLLLYALFSGVLFALGWPEIGNLTPFLFIAFVPLLLVEDVLTANILKFNGGKVFAYAYTAFFTFNILTTWWIYNASPGGMAGAVVFNSLFMAIVFTFFSFTKRYIGERAGYYSFIIYWLAFEYLHLNWQLSWPWLTLGNGLANAVPVIQWYEYTGALGGSLWILSASVFFFYVVKNLTGKSFTRRKILNYAIGGDVLLVLPLALSLYMYYSYEEKGVPVKAVVVQPNVDPYYEKFDGLPSEEQLDKMLRMAEQKLTPETDFVAFPETAIPRNIWEEQLEEDEHIKRIREFLKHYPQLNYVTGLSTNRAYEEGEEKPFTARQGPGFYYDSYNTAMQINNNLPAQLYHKSKLVIGVETTPYPAIFGFFENFAIDLGGITGSLGFDTVRKVFFNPDSTIGVAPVICYESIYGEYVGEYITKGANFIFIITNDGWWADTPGYKQHLSLARLRAVEMRRSIARSANTGISCFINQRGDVSHRTPWWEEAVISGTINSNDKITFYARYGDYIGRISAFLAVLLIAWAVAKKLNKTEQRLKNARWN